MPFEFAPYESRLTGTIADLIAAPGRIRAQALRAVGEARARAAEASGQRSAQLAQNLGQIASGTIGSIIEDRERAKALRVQQQRESIIRAVLPKVINGEMPPETLLEAAGPEDGIAIIKGLESYRQLAGKRVTDARATAGSLAAGLKKLPADMRASLWPRVREAAIVGGLGDEQTIPAQANDQFLDAILAWSGEKPEAAPTLIQRDPTRDLVNPQTGAVVTPGTPAPVKPPTPPAVGSFEDFVVRKFGPNPTPEQITSARKTYGEAGRADAMGGDRGTPYFTYQPTYDAQGRPTGAIRFDARGGPPTFVDVSALSQGGQIKPPPGDTGKMTILNETAEDQLDRLVQMFNAGGKDVIGPAEGRARAMGQNVPGLPVNQTFADFEAASAAFRNAVIKAITGAQMSEPEANRIRQQIPDVTNKPEVWRSRAAQTMKNLRDLKNRVKAPRGEAGAPPTHRFNPATGKLEVVK